MTAYQSMISIFIFIPFILPEVKAWNKLTLYPLLNLIYLGVFCSAFAYFFYNYAVKRLGPTISSAFLNLIPVVSVIFGMPDFKRIHLSFTNSRNAVNNPESVHFK